MRRLSCKDDFALVSVKAFAFKLADVAAVNRVSGFGFYQVKRNVVHSVAGLFVGRKANLDFWTRDFFVGKQIMQGGHNRGQTRLVVSAQESRSVACHDSLAAAFFYLRLDVFSGTLFHRVQVRQKAKGLCGTFWAASRSSSAKSAGRRVGRNVSVDVTVLCDLDAFKAQRRKLRRDFIGKDALAFR